MGCAKCRLTTGAQIAGSQINTPLVSSTFKVTNKKGLFSFFFLVLCPSLWYLFPETGPSGRRRISARRRHQRSAFQPSCLVFVSLHIGLFPAWVNRNCLAIVPEQTGGGDGVRWSRHQPSETALGDLKLSVSSSVFHLHPKRSPLKLPVKQSGPCRVDVDNLYFSSCVDQKRAKS